jgi:hypothetical protein
MLSIAVSIATSPNSIAERRRKNVDMSV